MIYDHIVKHNGRYYNPGEEVPGKMEPLTSAPEEVSDEDIILETDSAVGAKTSGKRGRPKKSE